MRATIKDRIMCGIAGLITHNAKRFDGYDLEDIVSGMLTRIRHRGPDEAGLYINDFAAIGTVRLSIIDIQNGQQPMMMRERYVLNYNGEVFNYIELRKDLESLGETFTTNSDTEVVLKSLINWGPEALSKFDGHFAISFYDIQENKLLLARDPFGEKPLFYTANNDFFAFGSEIKTLRALPNFNLEPDKKSLSHTACFWTPIPGESMFKNIRSLRAGHFMTIEGTTLNQKRYFDFPALNEGNSPKTYEAAQDELRALMDESIKRRLRSDVEVGSYLSGGLDSTIITCLAREIASHKLKTFSVTFDHPDYDESQFQKDVANHLGTKHHTIKIRAKDIVSNFTNAIEHAETALFRTALIPMQLLSKHVRANGIKVVLTGEGSDEFFMGYDVFKETLFRKNFDTFKDDDARIKEILSLYPYLSHFDESRARQLLQYFSNYTDQSGPFFSHELRFANGTLARQLLHEPLTKQAANDDLMAELNIIASYKFEEQSKLMQAQILDIKTLLEGYLLSSQGDRMASANSIEGRCPFLSTDIIKFAQNLPLEMKLSGGLEKKILRETFADKIPDGNALRRKQPYRAPDAQPFIADEEYANDLVINTLLKNTNVINPDLGKRLTDKLIAKKAQNLSPREDQAFIFMLSTLVLEQDFCHAKHSKQQEKLELKVKIDGKERRKTA